MCNECWACAEFERDPMNNHRGSCQVLADHVADSRGVEIAGPVYVKACSKACEDFNMTDAARFQLAEMAADAAIFAANQCAGEPESVRA